MRPTRALIAAVIVAAFLPATALASKAEVVTSYAGACPHALCHFNEPTYILVFRAAPGEANAITIVSDGQATTFTDTGAPLEIGPGCERVDEHTVRCARTGTTVVEAGDGPDTITTTLGSAPAALRLAGGPGDDVVTGGPGIDSLEGGGGRDRLDGGAGDDTVSDGDGSVPGADVLIGGAGRDTLSYIDRRTGVTVDLAAGRAGADRVTGFEDVIGGRGADRLAGDDGPNALYGEQGRDVLRGRGGNDLLDTRDRTVDRVLCGPGTDRVTGTYVSTDDDGLVTSSTTGPDAGDLLDATCEHVASGEPHQIVHAQPVSTGRNRVRFRKPCRSCTGRVTLRAGGRVIGTARLRDGARTVTVPLRRSLPRGRIVVDWDYERASKYGFAVFTVVLRPRAA